MSALEKVPSLVDLALIGVAEVPDLDDLVLTRGEKGVIVLPDHAADSGSMPAGLDNQNRLAVVPHLVLSLDQARVEETRQKNTERYQLRNSRAPSPILLPRLKK